MNLWTSIFLSLVVLSNSLNLTSGGTEFIGFYMGSSYAGGTQTAILQRVCWLHRLAKAPVVVNTVVADVLVVGLVNSSLPSKSVLWSILFVKRVFRFYFCSQ